MKDYKHFLNESNETPILLIDKFYKYVLLKKWDIISGIEKPKRARNVLYKFEYETPKGRKVDVTYNKFYKSIVIKTNYTKKVSNEYKDLDMVDKTYDIFDQHLKDVEKSMYSKKEKEKPSTPIKEKKKSKLPNFRDHGNYIHMWVDSDGDMWIKNDEIHNKFVHLKDLNGVQYKGSNWDELNDVKLAQFYYAKKK